MANQNGTAATILTSPGLFGGGIGTAGTGNSVGGFESEMPDTMAYAFTCDGASPATFTSAQAVTGEGAFVAGTPVTLGFTSGYMPYTVTAANPAVFTCPDITQAGNGLVTLNSAGNAVQLFGLGITGFTSSTPQQLGNAFPPNGVATTNYFIKGPSTNTFSLAATLNGSNISSAGGTAITALSGASMLQVVSSAPSGFAVGVVYYMASVSGNTFQLSPTLAGGIAGTGQINGGGTANAGIFQFQNIMQVANQIPIGASTTYQGIKLGGFRIGIQPAQVVASASSMSLDESPQMAWQNVAGATCQSGNANTDTGASTTGNTFPGWGQAGGYSTTGAAGQNVDELKAPVMHKDDNGGYETTEQRKVRLGKELDGLKAKSSPTAAETARKAVVESALNELK
jgi:hypothetical protein